MVIFDGRFRWSFLVVIFAPHAGGVSSRSVPSGRGYSVHVEKKVESMRVLVALARISCWWILTTAMHDIDCAPPGSEEANIPVPGEKIMSLLRIGQQSTRFFDSEVN